MSNPTIQVLGTTWCYDTHIVLDFFQKHDIEFEWVDIDQSIEAEQRVLQINGGFRSVPTIILEDGTTLTEPSRQELADFFLKGS